MSYTVSFMDNEPVTAEFLNSAAEELGGGALAFEDGGTYGVEHLNDISASLVTKGVSRGCALSVDEGQVTIGEGVLYLSDGRRVTIDEAGITMDMVPDAVNYVWFGFDAVSGFAAPRCTVEVPQADDVVVLGRVTETGDVIEKPDRAVMKHPFLGLHGTESYTKDFMWNSNPEEELLWEIDVNDTGYSYVLIHSQGVQYSSNTANAFCGFVDLSTKHAYSVLNYYVYADRGMDAKIYESQNGEVLVACSAQIVGRPTSHDSYYFVYLRFELGTDNVLRVYQRAEASGMSGMLDPKTSEIVITFC